MIELSYPDPELTDGVIRLRRWSEKDLPCIEEASRDPRIAEGTSVPAAFTADEGQAFVHRQWGRRMNGEGISQAIAEVTTNRAVGLMWLALRPQPGVAGLGYWLVPSARGNGLARRAVQLVTSWGLNQLNLARVEAWVEPGNRASHRTLLAAGFEREGVLRRFLAVGERRTDVVVYSRIGA